MKEIYDIISDKYRRYTAEIVNAIKAFPESAHLSGDDSPLKTVWEEVCFVMQTGQEPYCWGIYEESVRNCCEGLVESLPVDELEALWTMTDEYYEIDEEEEEEEEDVCIEEMQEAVANKLYDMVMEAAKNDTLPDEKLDWYF